MCRRLSSSSCAFGQRPSTHAHPMYPSQYFMFSPLVDLSCHATAYHNLHKATFLFPAVRVCRLVHTAFCLQLSSVILPPKITCIANGLFGGCSALVHVDIPNGVTSIGTEAFSGCSKWNPERRSCRYHAAKPHNAACPPSSRPIRQLPRASPNTGSPVSNGRWYRGPSRPQRPQGSG